MFKSKQTDFKAQRIKSQSYGSFREQRRRAAMRKDSYARLKEESVLQYSWFADGIFQAPRLRVDWNRLSQDGHSEMRYVSLNAFFDTLFAVTLTSLHSEIGQQQDNRVLVHWAQYFGMLISLWLSTAEYSSRFDNDDVSHKIFWSLYGVGILGLLMHVEGDPGSSNAPVFALCFAWQYMLLAGHWFRCAIAIKRARFHCGLIGVIMAIHMSISLWAGSIQENNHTRNLLFWILAFGYPLELLSSVLVQAIAARCWYPREAFLQSRKKLMIPLNNQFHIDRFSTLMLMVLAQVAKAVVWRPRQIFGNPRGLYEGCGCAFVVLVCLKVFSFDCDYLDADDHALRRSLWRGIAFLLIYPIKIGSLFLMGCGMELLIAEIGEINSVRSVQHYWAQQLTCYGFSSVLLADILMRHLHHIPYVRLLLLHQERRRASIVINVFRMQMWVQAGFAIASFLLPSDSLSSLTVLILTAASMVVLCVINLFDEALLLRTVEERGNRRGGGGGGGGGGGFGGHREKAEANERIEDEANPFGGSELEDTSKFLYDDGGEIY